MSVIYTPSARAQGQGANIPRSAAERAGAVLDMALKLVELIQSEIQAMERGDAQAIAAIVPRKQKLSYGIDELSRQLRVDRDGFLALPEEIKIKLKATNETLMALGDQTVRKMKIRSQAQQNLVDFYVRAINTSRQIDGRYTAYRGSATTTPPPKSYIPAASIDARL
jgi:hypothetical protein